MSRSLQGERDYGFGQRMLALRTSIGVTQEGLAAFLGVTRKAIGRWEAGETYPNARHLQEMLAFALAQRAFPPGEEEAAIRDFWRAAHQKMLLDEQWLQQVLSRQHPSLTRHTPPVLEEKNQPLPTLDQSVRQPRLDWGEAHSGPSFYGRAAEIATLTRWIVEERCRVVSVLGQGGIGKSTLSLQVMRQLAPHFEVVIWRSLRDAPSCESLLDQCLQIVAPHSLGVVPTTLERRLDLLLESLRSCRALIVLDNLETVLEEGDPLGRMRASYEGYGQLLLRAGEQQHQSCLLLTSREKASEIRALEHSRAPVRNLHLAALDMEACEQLLAEKELVGSQAERTRLINAYGGNPLSLTIVAQTIVDLFAGSIAPFLEQGEVVFGEIRDLLAQQFLRLSVSEQTVIFWLTIAREPITIEQLMALVVTPLSRVQILETTQALLQRNLIERGPQPGSFTLQSVIMEYATGHLLSEIVHEIKQGRLTRLIEHGLELTTVKEYVRQTQERLIVEPLLSEVRNLYQEQAELEEHLLRLLDTLRGRADYAQGYGPANLLTLLRVQRGHLRGLDLGRLSIRGAFLRDVQMQDTSLAFVTLRDTVFTESFDAIRAVAISPDGRLWATGSRRGKVQVWREGGKSLHLVWQAHTDTIRALAFSPDGTTLATGSWDGTLKMWEVEGGALLWTNWLATKLQRLAFAPNGQLLASGGGDAMVRLWDTTSGALVQTFPGHNSQVEALAWSQTGHWLASGSHDGGICIWERPEDVSARMHVLAGHASWVTGLAFAPDGRTLASGSVDQSVKLWEVESGRCLQTLPGQTQPVFALAWSLNGKLLASSGRNPVVWLWDVESNSYCAALHGHEAGVYAIAFTPDNRHLLSSSDDGTLRLWEIEDGRCVQSLKSYALSIYDVAWSPDGTKLASAGTDTLVTIWDMEHLASPQVLRGHSWVVYGVTWSPDGKMLASSSWDSTIRIWDATTGDVLQTMHDPDHLDALIFGIGWSPAGKWVAGASTLGGVHVWEVNTGRRSWVGQTSAAATRVGWSPDGKWLASGSDDGNVYVWDAASGLLQHRLTGHHGMIKSLAWSADSHYLASGADNQGQAEKGELFVWDAHSGQSLHIFEGEMGGVYALSWVTGTGGERLISGGSDGIVRWWDVPRGECVQIQKAHEGAVQSLKVSPTGSFLVSCGDDGAIHLWQVEGSEHLRVLRRDRPYERVNITGLRGLSEAQKTSLRMLGAFEVTHPDENA
jgi:WD40 repeat protein/transcriptional regulator with XRE-family HTH domain